MSGRTARGNIHCPTGVPASPGHSQVLRCAPTSEGQEVPLWVPEASRSTSPNDLVLLKTLGTKNDVLGVDELAGRVGKFDMKPGKDGSVTIQFSCITENMNIAWATENKFCLGGTKIQAEKTDLHGNILETTTRVASSGVYDLTIKKNGDGTHQYSFKFDPSVKRARIDLNGEPFLIELDPRAIAEGFRALDLPARTPQAKKQDKVDSPMNEERRDSAKQGAAEGGTGLDPSKGISQALPQTAVLPPPRVARAKDSSQEPRNAPSITEAKDPRPVSRERLWQNSGSGFSHVQLNALQSYLESVSDAYRSASSTGQTQGSICWTLEDPSTKGAVEVRALKHPLLNEGYLIALFKRDSSTVRAQEMEPYSRLTEVSALQVASIPDWNEYCSTQSPGARPRIKDEMRVVDAHGWKRLEVGQRSQPNFIETEPLRDSHPSYQMAIEPPAEGSYLNGREAASRLARQAQAKVFESIFQIKEQVIFPPSAEFALPFSKRSSAGSSESNLLREATKNIARTDFLQLKPLLSDLATSGDRSTDQPDFDMTRESEKLYRRILNGAEENIARKYPGLEK